MESLSRVPEETLDADIIIVGGGPCGTILGNLLGIYGVKTILLERELEILDYPRAVGIDDEALRSLQSAGLADDLIKDMVQNAVARYHHSNGKCFAQLSPSEQPFGWPRRNMFIQPLTEAGIRKGLERFGHAELMLGAEVITLRQDSDKVEVDVEVSGERKTLSARYLVGADGGRSTIRKLAGIELEGTTHAWRWLVVDLKDDDRFEPFSGVYCHPKRPHMSIDLPYGHRRFEFRLLPEETDEEMERPTAVQALLADKYPDGKIPEIIRSRIYTHHSRTADRFQVGRVFVAGDAAHLQPPFFGQGLNSGIRDVTNLAWKLAAVIQGKAQGKILHSYEQERRSHAKTMVEFATGIGKFYAPYNFVTEWFRKVFFWAVQKLPSARDYVLQMKFKPLPRYTEGVIVQDQIARSPAIGRMFMQPRVERDDGSNVRLDDAIGNWFSIVGVNTDPAAFLDPLERSFWRDQGATLVQVNRSKRQPGLYEVDPETLVLDDVTGAFRNLKLSRPGDEIIILRPDKYVAAICRGEELNAVSKQLRQLFENSASDGTKVSEAVSENMRGAAE